MPDKRPPLLSLALAILLEAYGVTGRALAAAAGIANGTVSGYLGGDPPLSREKLDWLASRVGLGPVEVERAIAAARVMHPDTPPPESPVDPTEEEWRILDLAAAYGLDEIVEQLRAQILREIREEHARRDREAAEVLFQRLKSASRAGRRVLVEAAPDYQTWALCVRLCDESEKLAAHCPRKALAWACLACRVARHVPATEAFRARLLAFARAFVANALRVKGYLKTAEKVLAAAWALWGQGTDVAGLLDEGRLLDLEASLCRDQRLFPEALELHRRALEVARPDQRGVILLNKAYTLEVREDYGACIEVLEQAALLIDEQRQPRLFFGMRFNWAASLNHLGRAQEAVPLVAEVRSLAERLRNDVDLIRTLWLEAQVLEGLGRREEAVAALDQVLRDFAARAMPYDHALAGLDLARLYYKQGNWPEVQALAAEMARAFRKAGVHRETLAAAALFHEAAARGAVTAELIQRLQSFFERARITARVKLQECAP